MHRLARQQAEMSGQFHVPASVFSGKESTAHIGSASYIFLGHFIFDVLGCNFFKIRKRTLCL
jgi:hypothetical protein